MAATAGAPPRLRRDASSLTTRSSGPLAPHSSKLRIVTKVFQTIVNGRHTVNDYAFLCTLGRGAYGEVVLARDLGHGQLVVRRPPPREEGMQLISLPPLHYRGRLGCKHTLTHGSPTYFDATSLSQAIKCYSKHRLLKIRDVVHVNGQMTYTTALDKVRNEIRVHRLLAAGGGHPAVARMVEVLADFSSDDMYLG